MSEGRFLKIKVTVVHNSDGTYTEKFVPEIIPVTESDSVLSFDLDNATAKQIRITGVTVSPSDNDQISTPSISKNGRQAICSDVNSVSGKFHLTFQYSDGERVLAKAAGATSRSVDFPEIDNVPPP